MSRLRRKYKIALVGAMVGVITLFHFSSLHQGEFQHLIQRDFYYIPLVLSAFWWGLRGGFLVSTAIGVLYLADSYFIHNPSTMYLVGNFAEAGIFVFVGILLGGLVERDVRRQRELRQSEALVAMGQAASVVAHDIKNPLMAIGGFARQIRNHATDATDVKKLDIIIRQTERLEILVKDMLAFAKPLELNLEPTVVAQAIEDTLAVVLHTCESRRVNIVTELRADIRIPMDQFRFQQALNNILDNAIAASPEGGEVKVRSVMKNDRIEIIVSDRGPGIPVEQREQIFLPFVTTKIGGTGLGMPTAKRIVEAHGGDIRVDDNEGTGTAVVISLPKTAE